MVDKKNKNKSRDDAEDAKTASSIRDTLNKNPGTLIMAPFVVLVGADIVLNLAVLVKRTLEFVAFGKLPSTETWFSDSFFFL